jgi:hydrogenase nickel incorporation protein HypB
MCDVCGCGNYEHSENNFVVSDDRTKKDVEIKRAF